MMVKMVQFLLAFSLLENQLIRVGKITRKNSTRSKTIRFDVAEGTVANNKVIEIKKWLEQTNQLKSRIVFTGQEEDQNEAKDFLIKAFL